MKTIFSALCRALSVGQGAVLCSVIASEGSTPRGAGAKMLVTEDGRVVVTDGLTDELTKVEGNGYTYETAS